MNKRLLVNIVSHAVAWLFLLSLPLLFLLQQQGTEGLLYLVAYRYYWLFNLSFIFLFYVHAYWLFPFLYVRNRHLLYFLSLAVLFLGFLYLKPFNRLVENNPRRPHPEMEMRDRPDPRFRNQPPYREPHSGRFPPPSRKIGGNDGFHLDVVTIFFFFMLIAFGATIQIIKRLRESEKKILLAETDKANAELSFLKAQINPHFLFNTLNNIYSLALTGSEHTADAVMRLSNIMRYVTDEVMADWVPLEMEAACLADFVELQKLRLSKKVTIAYAVNGNLRQAKIPPMVLMTFVENAFKYGVSNHEPAAISIELTVTEGRVSFSCRNKVFDEPREVVSTGIGITNTKQRLQHLYPEKHVLKIGEEDGLFTVLLELYAQRSPLSETR